MIKKEKQRRMPSLLILYHYFHPDDVISGQLVSQLGKELHTRGWRVTAMPCNRGYWNERKKLAAFENWNGVEIRRVWRPRFNQSSGLGRILNAAWMICVWSVAAFMKKTIRDVDVLLIGTDPILSVLVAVVWKLIRPKTRVVHWCFDLYPDAAVAQGILRPEGFIVGILKKLVKKAYSSCDLIVDIGPCMRAKIRTYDGVADKATLVPWAMVEPKKPLPVNVSERKKIFGNAKLAILYSGNFGRAHSCDMFVRLARRLRTEDMRLVFSIRGNRVGEAVKAVSVDDSNITFVPFASLERLEARLSAADIHLVSLRDEWTGTVVPSKFFGSLAAGRPVIFAGSSDSALAKWIKTYKVGWVLTAETLDFVAEELKRMANSTKAIEDLQRRSYQVYQETFSKELLADKWDALLRKLLRFENNMFDYCNLISKNA